MLELYHHSSSVTSAKVRIVLAEKDLQWTGHFVDLLKGENTRPEYRRINPNAHVPTLVSDGHVILESTIINEFLDDAFPQVPLRPAGAVERAGMRLWTKLLDDELHMAASVVTYTATHRHSVLQLPKEEIERFLEQTPDPSYRERKRSWIFDGPDAPDVGDAMKRFDRALGQMEDALSTRPWLAGEAYSLADAGLAPYVNRLDMLHFSGLWDRRPRVAAWFERTRERPSFRAAVTDHIPDSLASQMSERGRESWPAFRDRMLAA